MSLRNLRLRDAYQSSDDELIRLFYVPCLNASIRYDRAVGYFRSSIFAVINESLIDFALRRGKIRLVCSPSLDENDARAIDESLSQRRERTIESITRDVSDLLALRASTNGPEILATLIAKNILDIKIAIPRKAQGIFHDKLGVFTDESGGTVTFRGSINETRQAWQERGNFESFEVFSTFGSESDAARSRRHIGEFEMLWMNAVRELDVIDFPEVPKQRLISAAADSLQSLKKHAKIAGTETRKPRDHQRLVLESWRKSNFRGLVAHATGSGKTFTAILAIREHIATGCACVVLVPSALLLKQWKNEISTHIPAATILLAGDGNTKWRESGLLKHFLEIQDPTLPRVVLAVMKSAVDEYFINICISVKDLLVVADEVHQIGSNENSKFLSVESSKRLGLSATPNRYGDPDGTDKIFRYFGDILRPTFYLADGIREKTLCEYEYNPIAGTLNRTEADEWDALSKQISRVFAIRANKPQDSTQSAHFDTLVYRRLAIAKKAAEKIPTAVKILDQNYKEGQRWLVYAEDKQHLLQLANELSGFNAPIFSYYSGMDSNSISEMEWFKHHGGILLSIRCLDEGVDIPEISHAVILASSQNPRQYIQRRGRVLRPHKDKSVATIYDVIVRISEEAISLEKEGSQTKMSSFQRAELSRALAFAKDAMNQSAMHEVRQIARMCGIDDLMADDESGTEEADDE